MEILLDVISVKTRGDCTLELVFENGEKRIFDMKPFSKLLNSPLFFKASVHYGTVVWPGNIDMHQRPYGYAPYQPKNFFGEIQTWGLKYFLQ